MGKILARSAMSCNACYRYFPGNDAKQQNREKLEFADIRWMEITSLLRRESENGKKPVPHIEFKAERLDLTSIRKWRDKVCRPESA